MCGIYAVIAPKGVTCSWAPKALELLRHRGPDASGHTVVQLSWCSVTLGQTRLSIVDQGPVRVPWSDPREGLTVAYNGEIYNWRELRAELGGPWETQCDVEVLARAWRQWGYGCLDHLNGMFAFVLVDSLRNEVHAVRDRAGEKPLYWATRGESTYLASEAKALPVAHTERPCLDSATLEFDFAEDTPFAGVQSVLPGHRFSWSPARRDTSWWSLPIAAEDHDPDAEKELPDLLVDAIRLRAQSDSPIALQLSGGLDSSIIQAVVGSDRLYCVTFPDEGVDHLTAATAAAQGHPIRPVTFTREDMLEALPQIAYHLDTPATWTAVCQWFMAKAMGEDGVRVVLSGEGADELFFGYTRYRILWHLQHMRDDRHLDAYAPLLHRVLGGPMGHLLAVMLDRARADDTLDHAEHLIAEHGGPHKGSLVRRMARTDFYTTMQVLLRMADRMAMAHSIENRSPFFDYRLMELSTRLPIWKLVNAHQSKSILREIASDLGVPSSIVNEGTKRGLFIPKAWGAGEQWDRRWYTRLSHKHWENMCLCTAHCAPEQMGCLPRDSP